MQPTRICVFAGHYSGCVSSLKPKNAVYFTGEKNLHSAFLNYYLIFESMNYKVDINSSNVEVLSQVSI